jgi:hypothetical protein
MLPSKDEGGCDLCGLALRGLLAQAPQGEGSRAPLVERYLSLPLGEDPCSARWETEVCPRAKPKRRRRMVRGWFAILGKNYR